MVQQMSASQVQSTLREDVRTLDGADHIGADLLALQMEQNAEMGPEKPSKPVRLDPPVSGSFRFRTKPGLRMTEIKLRIFQENPKYSTDDNRTYKNNWEKNAQRVWGTVDPKTKKVKLSWKEALAPDQALFDRLGITTILFRPIPGRSEATYETRDAEVASYIRLRLNEPNMAAIIYEEVGPTMAQLADGTWVEVLPATDEARRQMAASAAGM